MFQRIKDWLWPAQDYDGAFEEFSRKRKPEGSATLHTNAWAQYHVLLREALEASEDVDDFDVCSADFGDALRFRTLQEAEQAAHLALIDHILANGLELSQRLGR